MRKAQRPLTTIPGTLPQIGTPLPTCVFVDRCRLATDLCREVVPPSVPVGDGQWSRCHHIDRIDELVDPAGRRPTVTEQSIVAALTMQAVSKTFHQSGHDVPALVKVDLELRDGETLGLVGESGSGKSTLAKAILGIEGPDTGSHIELDDKRLERKVVQPADTAAKRSIQMVFQNPDSALNRGWSVRRILGRSVSKLTGLSGQGRRRAGRPPGRRPEADPAPPRPQAAPAVGRSEAARGHRPGVRRRSAHRRRRRADERARRVGPGGHPQRPRRSSRPGAKTGYLLISHDLGVVRYLADRIAVMYLGRIQEVAESETLFEGPNHPYTEALLSAVPSVDGEVKPRIRLEGDIPSPANPPSGCVFHTRCHRFIAGPVRGHRAAAHRGRTRAPDALPHPGRRAASTPGPRRGRGRGGGRGRRGAAARDVGAGRRTW